jgi:AcrR family transcriptional regulator
MSHRDLLLDAARDCLATRGYARTTARDLVAASGTNLASIGYHFGSKEALLNEAIGSAFAEWTDEVNRVVRETPADAPLQRLLEGWKAMLSRTEANRPLIVAYFEALAQVTRTPELREKMADAYQQCRAKIAEVVRESLAGDDTIDADVVASFIMAVVDGLTLQQTVDPDRAPTGEQLVESLTLAVIALLRGLPAR